LAGCPNPNEPDTVNTGGITGKALFSGGNSHGGILVSLEETGGAVTQSVRAAARSGAIAARSVTASTSTGPNGAYEFNGVIPGTYTIYASSRDSSEGAVAANVVVTAGAMEYLSSGNSGQRCLLKNRQRSILQIELFQDTPQKPHRIVFGDQHTDIHRQAQLIEYREL
jgi:hypothetical protein